MNTSFKISNACYLLVCVFISYLVLFFPPDYSLSYDVFGYYMYLPLTFKYHDLTLQHYDTFMQLFAKYHPSDTFYQALKWSNGNWVMRYPAGTALMYSPFYFIADLIAPHTSYPADGFSRPYQLANIYGGLLYTITGLLFVKKILTQFFSDKVAALTLLCIALGTNYFFHVAVHGQGQMTHNELFCLYAMIIHFTIQWHETKKTRHIIWLGLAIGLASLCRASELISLFIPLLYGVTNAQTLRQKLTLITSHFKQILLFISLIVLSGSVQLTYYKYVSGHFFINPYGAGNPGEGFEFFHPHILEVLFSFRKGWFVYTPLMIFVCAGFYFLYKKNRILFWPLITYTILNLYIVSSWSCWWFGNCFGNRALIADYAALCIPLGYFFQHFYKSKVSLVYAGISFLFIALNLFQSWQMERGILDSTNMSRDYYMSTFLQTRWASDEQRKLLLQGKFENGVEVFDADDAKTHSLVFAKFKTYEKDTSLLATLIPQTGSRCLITGKNKVPLDSIVMRVEDVSKKSYTWIRASAWVRASDSIKSDEVWFEIHLTHKNWIYKSAKYKLNRMNLKAKTWNKIEYYYLVPDDLRSKKDKICIYFFNKSDQIIYLDDLMLESLEPIIDQSVF